MKSQERASRLFKEMSNEIATLPYYQAKKDLSFEEWSYWMMATAHLKWRAKEISHKEFALLIDEILCH